MRQVASTIALVVHMRKLADGQRVVETITDIDGAERNGVVRTANIFERTDDELRYVGLPRRDRCERLAAAGWRVPVHAPTIHAPAAEGGRQW